MSDFVGPHPSHRGKPLVVGENGTRRIFLGTPPGNAIGQRAWRLPDGDLRFSDAADGLLLGPEIFFDSPGVTLLFSKADYPDLRAVRVRIQGAGGGGGTAPATPTGQSSVASGGGGGAAAISDLIPAGDLPAGVMVTPGMGGAPGSSGEHSSFGSIISANGGAGGIAVGPTATTGYGAQRAVGGLASMGALRFSGGDSHPGLSLGAGVSQSFGGNGGNSMYGVGGSGGRSSNTAARDGRGYGGGGGGASASSGVAQQLGGSGAGGLVVVELYY